MAAIWYRARAEVRARWRPWVAIALLLGTFGGATAAVAAGARRTTTAYPRFLQHANSFDVFVADFAVFAPHLFWRPDFAKLERSPLVQDAAKVRFFFGTEDVELLGGYDDAFMGRINRPRMLEGRMPRAADEVSIPFAWTPPGDPAVGDTVRIGFDEREGGLALKIVGIHVMPGDFPPTDLLGEAFVTSPAFVSTYGEELPATDAMFIRLAPGVDEADIEAYARAEASGMLTNVYRNIDQANNVRRSFDLQAIALWFLAGGLGVATVLIVGQGIARQASLDATETVIVRALGMSRWQVAGTALIKGLGAGAIAGVVAVAIAVGVSPLFPRGSARVAEPSPGVAVDLVVALIAFGILVLVASAASVIPMVRARRRDALPATPSRAAGLAARLGLAPTTVAGVRFALEPGRGSRALPVRSTITTVALGLASLTAAFSFAANLHTLMASPDLYGRGWDHEYGFGGEFSAVPYSAADEAVRDPQVEAAAAGTLGLIFDLYAPGRQPVPVTGMALVDPIKGSVLAAPSEGRYPRRDEIVLGPRTMDELGIRVGEVIQVGLQGSDARPMRVVGEVLLPPLAEQSQFGDGVLVHYDSLTGDLAPTEEQEAPPADQLLVRFSDDRPLREQVEAFRTKLEDVDRDFQVFEATDLVNFGRVQNLPLVLAGLLAALAAGALAHVLLTAIRRRRRDIAILKTVGFDRGQARRAVAWQASTVVAIALAIGIPAGIVAGRALWSLFASRVYVLVRHDMPWEAIAITIPAALLLANLIAWIPARAAARTRPASELRSE